MRNVILFLCICAVFLSAGCSIRPIQHDTEFYGLLIGINYDTNPAVKTLDWCEADAASMKESLLQNSWEEADLTTLYGSAATKSAIIGELTSMVAQAGQKDYILVYFSGHGTEIADANGDEADGDDEALVPEDYVLGDGSTLIIDDELNAIFSSCKTAKGAFIVDSCFSGGLVNRSMSATGYRVKYIEGAHPKGSGGGGDLTITCLPVMTASSQNEESVELDSLKHGLFTYYLTQGLDTKLADKNNDKFITVRELFEYAENHTEYYPYPQHPVLRCPLDFIDILITR
jgi:acyl carrier protein